mmetsp:Transcript_16169/g.40590  ORF Transcript_16169/g.40590 Transcript_16169/m.40590 type:complete len:877 (-) Transcript_16169:134-2764(-)
MSPAEVAGEPDASFKAATKPSLGPDVYGSGKAGSQAFKLDLSFPAVSNGTAPVDQSSVLPKSHSGGAVQAPGAAGKAPASVSLSQLDETPSDPKPAPPPLGLGVQSSVADAATKSGRLGASRDGPVFSFSTNENNSSLIKSITSGRSPAGVEPTFSFDMNAPTATTPPGAVFMPTKAALPITLEGLPSSSLAEAAATPLPPEDESDGNTVDNGQPSAHAAGGWDDAFLKNSSAASQAASAAISQDIETQEGGLSEPAPSQPAVAVSTAPSSTPLSAAAGWGGAFLKANASFNQAASNAIAEEIVQSKCGAPIPLPVSPGGWGNDFLTANASANASTAARNDMTSKRADVSVPAPASGGWGDAFLEKNEPAKLAASSAVAAEINEQKGKASALPVAGGGWGDAFLKANASASATAAAAVQKEIEKEKGGSSAPAAASSGWGAGFLQAKASAQAAVSSAVAQEIEKHSGGAAAPPVSSGGWGDAFLRENASAGIAAAAAAERDIKEQGSGSEPAAAPPVGFGASANEPPSISAAPTASAPAAGFTFGLPSGSFATAPSATNILFRAPASQPASQPGLSFGAVPGGSSSGAPAPLFSFGASRASAAAGGTFTFGMGSFSAAVSQPAFVSTTTAPASTGMQNTMSITETPSPASAATATPAFGTTPASTPSFSVPSLGSSAMFGSGAAPGFGASAPAGPVTTFGATPAFGADQQQQPSAGAPSTPGSMFGAPAASAPSFAFGAALQSAGPASSAFTPSFGFGASADPASAAASSFGGAAVPFGAPQSGSAFDASPAPSFAFGAAGSSAPAFGAGPAASNHFGASTAPAGHGSTAQFSFGAGGQQGGPAFNVGGGGRDAARDGSGPTQRRILRARRNRGRR